MHLRQATSEYGIEKLEFPTWRRQLRHFPEKIETERLVIRVAKPGDGQVLNQAVLDSLTELAPWVNWVTPPPSVEESEAVCRKAYGKFLLHKLTGFL